MILRVLQSLRPTDPKKVEQDIRDELAFHLQHLEQDFREAGDPDPTARALARFGDPIRIEKECRDIALRETVMKQRVYVVTIIVLALALGLTILYSVALTRRHMEAAQAQRAAAEAAYHAQVRAQESEAAARAAAEAMRDQLMGEKK